MFHNGQIVYRIPFWDNLERFQVVKALKKEMILKDCSGKVFRITPAQFHEYSPDMLKAVLRALRSCEDSLKHNQKRCEELISQVSKLRSLYERLSIKSSSEAKA